MRIGQGFDVHQLVERRKLIIGGVEILHDKGLLGHSDADVLLHAICDALLGAAALGDIGLTTSLHRANNCEANQLQCREAQHGGEPEIEDALLDKLTLYTATLAVPSQREASNPITIQGMALFRTFGCANCHLPTQQSGPHPLPELAHQTFHPFTDLLLHDMGDGLADNRPEFEASGREWRTPPLWGLGLVPLVNGHDNLLHDRQP